MNNEDYGIELKLITDKFKTQMANITNSVKSWANRTKQSATVIPDVQSTPATIRIRELEREIVNLKKEMADTEVGTKSFNEYALAIDSATAELNQLKNELNQVNKTSKNADLKKNFEEATKSGRKFIMSLFSLRSIWSLISRASSSYIQTNDALNSKIQLTSQIFGSMLAPAIKKVIDLSQYAVIILAKVIQLFTGYNALANLTTSSLNKTSKASKSLSKSLASFDTITNLGDKTSGVSSDIASSVDALEEFQQKINKVEEIFKKYEDEIKLATIALGVMFGAGMLNKISKFLGVSSETNPSGLLGVKTVLGLLGKAVVITVVAYSIYEAIEAWKEYKEVLKSIEDTRDKMSTKYATYRDEINKETKEIDKLSESGKDTSKSVENLSTKIEQQSTDLNINNHAIAGTRGMWERLTGQLSDSTLKTYKDIYDVVVTNTDAMKEQYSQGRLNEEEQKQYANILTNSISTLKNQNQYLDKNTDQYKANEEKIRELETSLIDLTGQDYETTVRVKGDTSSVNKTFSNFFSKVSESFGKLFDANSWSSGILKSIKNVWKGASYDVGTNYVPNDQLAMVHKGEQIIPAKWNPATSGIYNTNDEVVHKLDRLITVLENKRFDAKISAEDVGRSSVNYINEQSRIMGRSVIK